MTEELKFEQVSEIEQNLARAALAARSKAYAPYSKFRVGAAVLADDGQIYTGCNIENSSYGATNCAERTAIFKAVSTGARSIQKLAVITDAQEYARPCGICRQVISEFAAPDFVLLALHPNGGMLRLSLEQILPLAFKQASLENK